MKKWRKQALLPVRGKTSRMLSVVIFLLPYRDTNNHSASPNECGSKRPWLRLETELVIGVQEGLVVGVQEGVVGDLVGGHEVTQHLWMH